MRIKILLFTPLILLNMKAIAQSSIGHDKDLVRVRLFTSEPVLEFEGLGLRVQNIENPYRPIAIPQETKTVIRAIYRNQKWLWAVKWPGRATEVIIPGKFLMIQGQNLRGGNRSLPEKIFLSPEKNKVDVVGVVELRDYLVGVLKSEMPLAWPLETLKAQAVAARSYALAVMKERSKKVYHLESSILDQVYEAIHYDTAHTIVQRALQAVDETRNEILQSSNKKVLKAFFHADCGGRTVSSKEVWSGGIETGTTLDASCPHTPKARWTYVISKAEVEKRMRIGAISEINYQRNPDSDRIQKVSILLKSGKVQNFAANEFRGKIGFQEIKSTWFRMSNSGEDLIFSGKGFGHGVGLCQWGSRTLGRKGLTYKAILQHYYPLASLN